MCSQEAPNLTILPPRRGDPQIVTFRPKSDHLRAKTNNPDYLPPLTSDHPNRLDHMKRLKDRHVSAAAADAAAAAVAATASVVAAVAASDAAAATAVAVAASAAAADDDSDSAADAVATAAVAFVTDQHVFPLSLSCPLLHFSLVAGAVQSIPPH